MSNDPTAIEVPRGTAMFTRKLSAPYAQYEHAEASIYVQFPVDFGNLEATEKAAKDALEASMRTVFEKLGVPYVYDAESDRLVEAPPVAAPRPVITDHATVGRTSATVGMTASELEAAFPNSVPQAPNPFPQPAPAGGVPPCPACGGAMWDNRATATGKQPQAKCKNAGKWNGSASVLPNGQPGCKGVIFDVAKGK